MNYRFLPDGPVPKVRLSVGQTVLIDPSARTGGSCLEVIEGIALGTATGGSEATNTDADFTYPYVGRTL